MLWLERPDAVSSYGSYMTSCYAHYTPNEAHEENIKRLHSSHQHGHSQLFFIPTLSLVSTVTSFLPLMKPVDLASSTIGLAPKSIVRSHHRCSWRRQTLSLQPPLVWAERMVRTTERWRSLGIFQCCTIVLLHQLTCGVVIVVYNSHSIDELVHGDGGHIGCDNLLPPRSGELDGDGPGLKLKDV